MVIIKLIGRTTDFKGNTLWEILGNLKNYGVGRIISRSMFERYSEPSYIKILKVDPQPNEEGRKVKVLVEKTFRGRTQPLALTMLGTTYKADYKLIPKDEEEAYCKTTAPAHEKIIPSKMEFPPLLKQFILRDYAKNGIKKDPSELFLSVHLKTSPNKAYKKADENSTEVLPIGLGTELSKHLYPEQKV